MCSAPSARSLGLPFLLDRPFRPERILRCCGIALQILPSLPHAADGYRPLAVPERFPTVRGRASIAVDPVYPVTPLRTSSCMGAIAELPRLDEVEDSMAFKSRERQECSVRRCRRPVVTCCFQCDRPYCDHHLAPIWLPFLEQHVWISGLPYLSGHLRSRSDSHCDPQLESADRHARHRQSVLMDLPDRGCSFSTVTYPTVPY